MLDSALYHHHQNTKWGNIFWTNGVHPSSRLPETCRIKAKAHWSCSGSTWWPITLLRHFMSVFPLIFHPSVVFWPIVNETISSAALSLQACSFTYQLLILPCKTTRKAFSCVTFWCGLYSPVHPSLLLASPHLISICLSTPMGKCPLKPPKTSSGFVWVCSPDNCLFSLS